MTRSSITSPLVPLMWLIAGALGACDPERPCDPWQTHEDSICMGPQQPPPDKQTCEAPPLPGFNATCTSPSQCAAGLDECVVFMEMNYCTRKGCDLDPCICPSDWECLDLTAFGAGHICSRPSE